MKNIPDEPVMQNNAVKHRNKGCTMLTVHKKIVIDKKGKPTEVIIPWEEYREMEELLGLDLDKAATEDIKQAKIDRKKGRKNAYIDLDSI